LVRIWLAGALGLAVLAARLVLPAAWLAGTPLVHVAAFALVAVLSAGALLWRLHVGAVQAVLLRGPARALALGAQKSLALVALQYWTRLPLHSPLLLAASRFASASALQSLAQCPFPPHLKQVA
jgi:hypothetical protein